MGQIDHHAKGVHLSDDLFPEGAQAVPMRPLGGTVRDSIVTVVRECHIADAQAVKSAEHRQGLLDGRSVLHADEYGNQPVLRVLCSLVRRECQSRIVRVVIDGVIDGGNHLQRIPGGRVRRHLRRCVQGEKRAADSPAPKLGEVDVPVAVVDAQVPEPDQLRRGIDMTVKNLHYFVP